MESLQAKLSQTVKELYGVDLQPEFTRPEAQFGDFATNAAMKLAAQLGKPPREIAETLSETLRSLDGIAKAEVAGPGFINLTVTDEILLNEMQSVASRGDKYGCTDTWAGKTVVTEYSDPNPFKVLHAGHLYTSVVGDSISKLFEAAGANVHSVNFGGDVGLHVGKSMWAILKKLEGENPEKLDEVPAKERANWMAEAYVTGTAAYEDDEIAKHDITELNKRVYQLFADNDHESQFARIYWTTRQWSYDYFDAFYARIGSHFEKYYPESEVADLGLRTVKEHQAQGVFEESDGAIVFKGEPHGLHTRVFINSQGLPTYEAKDVGLVMSKFRDYKFDKSVIITGSEQQQYMEVVIKAIEQFEPELAKATTHLTHGMVKLQGGQKMSSRKGNILKAVDVLDAAAAANHKATGKDDERVTLGAVKYAFLKQRMGPDIIFHPDESVNLEGNSGPYLQYAHARAASILRKAWTISAPESSADEVSDASVNTQETHLTEALEPAERLLLRKISEYPDVVASAVDDLMPHYVATYLYELAQTFNRFYEHNRVVGDTRQALRLQLIKTYTQILKNGLGLLNIDAPDSM